MRLVLLDIDPSARAMFHPLSLSRPIWELWSGMSTLREKLLRRSGCDSAAYFVLPHLAEAYRQEVDAPVNDAASLRGADLLVLDCRVRAESLPDRWERPAVYVRGSQMVGAYLPAAGAKSLPAGDLPALLAAAKTSFPNRSVDWATWDSVWSLMEANGEAITRDFAARGLSGVEGVMEAGAVIRGSGQDVFVGAGATVHPLAVLDATAGPVVVDAGAEIQSFTRVEGPAYVGPRSVLLGAKCRAGTSIGPVCRIGGEVEQSILLGYVNKYHEGFLGHAVVGQWVNLGALTTNSDLKNDYTNVSVMLDGRTKIDTGSQKVGALIGDHAKTSVGTLLNTGAMVGGMSMVLAAGRLAPKCIPSFSWLWHGRIVEAPDRGRLYAAAGAAMARRGKVFTAAQQQMWEAIYTQTASVRAAVLGADEQARVE